MCCPNLSKSQWNMIGIVCVYFAVVLFWWFPRVVEDRVAFEANCRMLSEFDRPAFADCELQDASSADDEFWWIHRSTEEAAAALEANCRMRSESNQLVEGDVEQQDAETSSGKHQSANDDSDFGGDFAVSAQK